MGADVWLLILIVSVIYLPCEVREAAQDYEANFCSFPGRIAVLVLT